MSVTKSELQHELSEQKAELKLDIADVKVKLVDAVTTLAENLKHHFDFTVEQIRSVAAGTNGQRGIPAGQYTSH